MRPTGRSYSADGVAGREHNTKDFHKLGDVDDWYEGGEGGEGMGYQSSGLIVGVDLIMDAQILYQA